MAVTRQQTGGHVLLTAGARWTDIFTLILVSVDRYLFHIYPNFHPLSVEIQLKWILNNGICWLKHKSLKTDAKQIA